MFGDIEERRAWAHAVGGRMRAAIVGALIKCDDRPTRRGPPRLHSRMPGIGAGLAILLDPIAFQRRGHAALGDVFSVSILGQELFFISGEETLARLVGATSDELDLVAAYRKMFGRLLGEDLFTELPVDLLRTLSGSSVRRRSASLAAFAGEFVRARLGGGGEFDGLALANDIILHMSCRFVCGDRLAPERCAELARLFDVLGSDFSVLGVFLPVETPSMRRRQAARARILAIFEEEVRRAVIAGADDDGYMQAVLNNHLGPEPARAPAEQVSAAALTIMGAVLGAHTNTALTFAASLAYVMVASALIALLRDYHIELREQPRRWYHVWAAGLARPIGRFTFAAAPRGHA